MLALRASEQQPDKSEEEKEKAAKKEEKEKDEDELPPGLMPICLGVFVQMLGEGIAIASIPLYLTSLGATPVQVGLATSAFSIAQMLCCPAIVALSTRIGRTVVLRICLAGATASGLIIALSTTIPGVIFGRFLAGVFAASVPVAQAGVTDIVSGKQSAVALSRVATASQLGVVVGPGISAVALAGFTLLGLDPHLQIRAVFATSAVFALGVLAMGGQNTLEESVQKEREKGGKTGSASIGSPAGKGDGGPLSRLVHPLLRLVALAVGWSLTLSVSTYCLLSQSLLGWDQRHLSTAFSAGAAITVFTQLYLFPRLVKRVGEHVSCSLGLASVALGLVGCSTMLLQPFHSILYFLNRVGSGIADTSTATLVARYSDGKEQRSQNLALIQSTRAGARIVTPLISGKLFEIRAALPYFADALLLALLLPAPLLLKKMEERRAERAEKDYQSRISS